MLLPTLAQAAAAFLATQVLPAIAASISHRATICNGHAELCSRSYGNVSFVGAHDSYAVGTDVASNQDYNVTQQLNDGVRLLQVQALQQSDGIHLCHTSCLLKDGGLAVNYLKTVKTWVDANPNDVVTILIVNINNLPPTQWQSVYQSAQLDTVSFSPSKSPLTASEWPTLGSMIDSGKRVVTFLDNQADFATVPYIIDEFTNVWETPFDVTEASFPCSVNRTQGDSTTQLNLINHYLDQVFGGIVAPSPNKNQLNVTNGVSGPGSLGQEVTTCVNAHGRPPNFLLVDFYEFGGGSVFQVAANINGVQYAPTSPIATPITGSAAASGSTTSTPLNSSAFEPLLSARGVAAWVAIVTSVMIGALVSC
ncbi:PLC-like phosphodiesterase [Gautieria morchelliformis]|nr:PLC-like phosphodiesterase [Gautieria morchelliformis]